MKMIKKIAFVSAIALISAGMAFASGKSDVEKTTNEAVETVKDTAKDAANSVKESVDNSVNSAVEAATDKATETVNNAAEKAVNALEGN